MNNQADRVFDGASTEGSPDITGTPDMSAISGQDGDQNDALLRLFRAWQIASPSTAPKDLSQYGYTGPMAKRSQTPVADRISALAGAHVVRHAGVSAEDAHAHVLRMNRDLARGLKAEQAAAS